jgi:hypothetical protein
MCSWSEGRGGEGEERDFREFFFVGGIMYAFLFYFVRFAF